MLLYIFFYFSPYSEFPRITNEDTRIAYKQEFDRDHQEYKDLQAELDSVNRKLSDVDKELDDLQPGSPQFLVSNRFFFFPLFSPPPSWLGL